MDVVVGIVGSIATKAAEYTLSPIKNCIKYLSNHENNVQTLKNQAERLKNARERVLHSIDVAKCNGEEIEHDVERWLSTVDKILEEVEKVMQDEEKAKKKCFSGLCPNFCTRYKHSMKAEEQEKAVAELLKQGNFDRVSYRPALHGVMATSVKDFEEFESRMLVLNGLMEALKDDSVSVIGVQGMGGVGKTTLVREVAREAKEGKLFDSVVIATVTQTLDVKEIQNQIADLLSFKFEEQSMVGRALRLKERLKKEKKILVVLDDIWAELDFEGVGIPFGDEHKGCKVLLTSRNSDVLSMHTQENFAVKLLNEEEVWGLFKKMAGDCVESRDLKPIAMEVAKECAGLPIAIATVARALKNKSLPDWRNALRELKRPSSSNFTGTYAPVYSAIGLSYSYLESLEVKRTFLLCSLMGHNGSIEGLVRYALGLRIFAAVNTMEESRDKVLTVVAKLKASCLLLASYNDERFDIHDLVWDVALATASKDHYMLVLRDSHELKEWPDKEKMKNCDAISFQFPRIIAELPEEMDCSGLSFFHMAHDGSVKIPSNFFGRTESLKVLDLFGMRFPSLPASIDLLSNLHTLCLKQCALEDITIIGKLKNLEILSLAKSDIKVLPQELAQLTRLMLLDLSRCTKLKIIPPNVLASLSQLEELFMDNSFALWEDEVVGQERRNASLDELNHLPHLTTLYAHIPNAQMIPKLLVSETLHRFRIFIGDFNEWDWYKKNEYSRTLKINLYTSIYLGHGVKMLLKKTEDLYLEGLVGIENVLAELNNGEDFPHLKKLHVRDGLQVRYITMKKIQLPKLHSITLKDLPQLISFCSEDKRCSTSQREEAGTSSEPLPLFSKQLSETYCVPNLTSLIISSCGKLEHLLSPSIARSLVQLQHFKIAECKCLRDVIFTEGVEEEKKAVICFPRLNSLRIRDLPNLMEFCSENYSIEFPSLKKLKIQDCPDLKEFINESKMEEKYEFRIQALFSEKVAVPSLERMTVSGLRNVKMIFHNELQAGSFCKLEEMTVECCDELSTIFSSTMVGVFKCLETLSLKNCDSVEQIFELEGLNIEGTLGAEYCQLRELCMGDLPKLKHVWNKDPKGILTFQNLRKVDVWDCPSLKNLFPASVAKDLPRLEDLTIRRCGVEEIVSAGEGLEQPVGFKFPQVSSLYLKDLKELKCFYPGQHTIVWPMLKKLSTDYSTLLKIVASERLRIQETNGNGQRESTIGQPLFLVEEVIPKLEELKLWENDDIAMIRNDQFPADFFHQIKVFRVKGSHGESIFPFLERFYNLESLELSNFDFKGLVPCKGDVAEKRNTGTLPLSRKLKLKYSRSLEHIWKEDKL